MKFLVAILLGLTAISCHQDDDWHHKTSQTAVNPSGDPVASTSNSESPSPPPAFGAPGADHHLGLMAGTNITWWDDYVDGHYTTCYWFSGTMACVISPEKTK